MSSEQLRACLVWVKTRTAASSALSFFVSFFGAGLPGPFLALALLEGLRAGLVFAVIVLVTMFNLPLKSSFASRPSRRTPGDTVTSEATRPQAHCGSV